MISLLVASSPPLSQSTGFSLPFSTDFSDDENPISNGGIWTLGATHGNRWEDIRASGGLAYDVEPADGPTYNDALAFLQGKCSPTKHYIKGTVFRDAEYAPTSTHELLLHVLGNMSEDDCPSYEFNINLGSSSVQMVRYEGPSENLGDFVFDGFTQVSGSLSALGGLANGDTLEVRCDIVDGNPRFYLLKNGSQFCVMEDSQTGKHVSGNPGFGTFRRYASGNSDTDPARYCWSAIEIGNW